MPKKLIINTCEEDLGKMIPNKTGKFCMLCQKNVHNLVNLPDETILKMLQEKGSFCGQMTLVQKQRINRLLEKQSQISLFQHAKMRFLGLVSLVISSVANVSLVYAQENKGSGNQTSVSPIETPTKKETQTQEPEIIVLKGKVFSDKGFPIPNADIFPIKSPKEDSFDTKTDKEGYFEMEVYKNSTIWVGAEEHELLIFSPDQIPDFNNVQVYLKYNPHQEEIIYGGISAVPQSLPKRIWYKMKYFFIDLFSKKE